MAKSTGRISCKYTFCAPGGCCSRRSQRPLRSGSAGSVVGRVEPETVHTVCLGYRPSRTPDAWCASIAESTLILMLHVSPVNA